MLRINVILCLLLILCGCSKNETEVKLYKTTVCLQGLQMFPAVDSSDTIFEIPYKSKVEVVDKKKYYDTRDKSRVYSKIKYKETTGYVLSSYLSDRDDVPFVDDVKYDYKLNEFDYDRDIIIKTTINKMYKSKYWKDEIQYYYTENPQIFTLYGKNCDDLEVKRVVVIMVSKLTPNYNEAISYDLEDNKLVPPSFDGVGLYGTTIEEAIEAARNPSSCCGGC